MNFWQLLVLGLIAGGTIYIGLPVGRLRGLDGRTRALLTMLSAGILIYLMVEILGEAAGDTAGSVQSAVLGTEAAVSAAAKVLLLILGLLVGLVGLVAIQDKWITKGLQEGGIRLSYITAAGIGLHNLSEGLAIGQSFAMGKTALAIGLVIGFALHNATEGFGIVGASARTGERLSWPAILVLGAIGGGPTFVGTLLGSLWTSEFVSIFVLAMAGGAILYVVKELLFAVRKETAQKMIMAALAIGFGLGWGTEVVAATAQGGEHDKTHTVREADGDVLRAAASKTTTAAPVSAEENTRQRQVANELLHEGDGSAQHMDSMGGLITFIDVR